MADTPAMPAVAAAAAEAAVAAVTAEAAVAETVTQVVESAQERVEQAQENADALAAAALESERGRNIEDLRREVSACQTEMNNLRGTLETSLTEIRNKLETLTPQTTVAVISPAPENTSLIPPASATPAAAVVTTAVVQPNNQAPADDADALPAAEKRVPRRRRI